MDEYKGQLTEIQEALRRQNAELQAVQRSAESSTAVNAGHGDNLCEEEQRRNAESGNSHLAPQVRPDMRAYRATEDSFMHDADSGSSSDETGWKAVKGGNIQAIAESNEESFMDLNVEETDDHLEVVSLGRTEVDGLLICAIFEGFIKCYTGYI